MSPLEEATTEELIDELKRRFPCLIIGGEKAGKLDDTFEGIVRVYGGLTVPLGLYARLGFMLDEMLYDSKE